MSNDKPNVVTRKELQILVGVAGVSTLVGFGITLAMARRSNPNLFVQSLRRESDTDSGLSLALRALGRGTLYATTGFGVFCFVSWKLLGVHSMEEFTAKVRSVMPTVPKKESQGRSDFKTIREVVDYLLEEDDKKKRPR